jgi:hypothetical protein
MARASIPTEAASELYLIPGEAPDTRDLDDARQWITIYRELVAFFERALKRTRRETAANRSASRRGDADERWMEGRARRLLLRLDFWERRLWELAGLDLDVRRRVLAYAGRRFALTRRETELLAFLAGPASSTRRRSWQRPVCRAGF